MKRILFIISALALLLCGCTSSRENLAYFSLNNPGQQQVAGSTDWQLKIVPDDELVISVTSEVPEATAMYNLPMLNTSARESLNDPIGTAGALQTYVVDRQGNIKFPRLGVIHVEGMTVAQLADELTRRIAEDVEAPFVRVELINFKVNVLGEVQKPGIIHIPTERFTILDALAQAGDLTIFGRRDNVTLVREVDGKITYNRVNLNDARLIDSPYYYLQQNDAIYVEPTEVRKGQAEYNQNNSYKLSVISTIVSGVSVIASLVIALAVK